MKAVNMRSSGSATNETPARRIATDYETFGDSKLMAALAVARQFAYVSEANQRDYTPHWLSLLGTTYTGKTMLATRLWQHFDRYGRYYEGINGAQLSMDGRWVNLRRLSAELKEGCWGQVDDICQEYFVVLDDVGADHDPSAAVASALERILDARLGRWTVLTSNYTLAQIAERLDSRIASRIKRGGVVMTIDTQPYHKRHAPTQ